MSPVSVQFNLHPFTVPDRVQATVNCRVARPVAPSQGVPAPSWVSAAQPPAAPLGSCFDLALSAISPDDLDRLCADFRAQVFKKANAEMLPEAAAVAPRLDDVQDARVALGLIQEMLDEGVILGDCQALTQAIAKVLQQP